MFWVYNTKIKTSYNTIIGDSSMIIEANFIKDDDRREVMEGYTPDFPCACKLTNVATVRHQNVTWHWHPVFELNYIMEGEADYLFTGGSFHLKKGDAIFYNTDVLHSVKVTGGAARWKQYTIFFDINFLAGIYNSVWEMKYIAPVVRSKKMRAVPITPDSRENIRMISEILAVIDLFREESFGYEFEIRSRLSHFWCMFLQANMDKISTGGDDTGVSENVRDMIEFIQENFHDRILLKDIAAAGMMSERECTRLFNRSVHMAPVQYLNHYRVHMAARMLRQSDDPIALISEKCGFSSAAYFSKVFKEEMGELPKDYRAASIYLAEEE